MAQSRGNYMLSVRKRVPLICGMLLLAINVVGLTALSEMYGQQAKQDACTCMGTKLPHEV